MLLLLSVGDEINGIKGAVLHLKAEFVLDDGTGQFFHDLAGSVLLFGQFQT